ncbi:nuclear body protein SP140-like protein isoform X2 [Centropristis striata]|uniref:nuclear body protein SP140-like protein isoform X2 n=1 Tax=Centropristis striata TaxID=184440 RepID=UPI0027E16FF5|nr:nuclear body protein SP140-like protein isoform X2 [Centropristis striata]
MDPATFWLDDEELLRFFHRHKTEMSCMENPHTFLSQLRDHDLVPEDRYKKVSRMKSKDNLKKGLYEILERLEKDRPQLIKLFWTCVFKETIMNHYPALRLMRNSLMDASEKTETEETEGGKSKELSDDEEGEEQQAKPVKKKRKRKVCGDKEEQAGPSSKMTPVKKSKKISFSSPRKGENNDIWTWPLYKLQLPVTCGDQKGMLHRGRLAAGEKCIVADKQWFTPNEFQRFGGKESAKNWKLSIRCKGTPLAKLIQEDHLKVGQYKGGCKNVKRSLFRTVHLITVSDGEEDEDEDEDEDSDLNKEDQVSSSKESFIDDSDEEEETEEQTEQQPGVSHDSKKTVFKITCGALAATLHKKRFASGTKGKSIRTETSWMSPVEFVKEASLSTDASWRKDIQCEGEPLSVLIEAKILDFHSLLCDCSICKPDSEDLENQKNDDECCTCKGEDEEEELVECDHCPRSFHKKCHLPHVGDTILGDSSPWMCTFCVLKTTQGYLYLDEVEREAAMSRQISQRMLQCQYLLLRLCTADEEQIFTSNPCQYLTNYSKIIKTPMWLGKIADKLQSEHYKTVREFESDVQLVFTNCALYNRNNAEFLAMGKKLKELFDKELNNVFNIREQTDC